jgi:hypothetical protein
MRLSRLNGASAAGLIALAALAGCSPPPAATGDPAPPGGDPTSASARPAPPAAEPHVRTEFGATYVFRPAADPPGDMAAALAALQTGFAADPAVLAFFRKLHGGLAVKLEVLPPVREADPRKRTPEETEALAARSEAAPAAGFPVVLRVTFDPQETRRVENGKAGRPELYGAGVGGVEAIWFARKPAGKAGDLPPNAQVALLLAANDFLLRKDHGWLLFEPLGGDAFPDKLFEKTKANRAAYRAHLDEQATVWANAFRAHWTERGVELK